MAQRNGQSVGGVGRLRDYVHGEKCAHHRLHLAFVRVAMAGNVGFHFARRIAMHFQTMLRGGQEHHATHFRQPKGRTHVQSCEDTLDGQDIGRIGFDQSANQLMYIPQGSARTRHLAFCVYLQGAIVQHPAAPAIAFDYPVARRPYGRGVDPQNAHPSVLFAVLLRRIHPGHGPSLRRTRSSRQPFVRTCDPAHGIIPVTASRHRRHDRASRRTRSEFCVPLKTVCARSTATQDSFDSRCRVLRSRTGCQKRRAIKNRPLRGDSGRLDKLESQSFFSWRRPPPEFQIRRYRSWRRRAARRHVLRGLRQAAPSASLAGL
jgi:hypothetical protein